MIPAVMSVFLDEFMSFVGILSSIDCQFCICGDFNIHNNMPGVDDVKYIYLSLSLEI